MNITAQTEARPETGRYAGSKGYMAFEGRPTEVMPTVDLPGYRLISPERLFEKRLEGDLYLRSNNIIVDVVLLPNPDYSEAKLVKGCKNLLGSLRPETHLNQGALPFDKETYEKSSGLVIPGKALYALLSDPYAVPDVRKQVWEFLSQQSSDPNLAERYEADVKETLDLDFEEVMGLGVPGGKGLRVLVIGGYNPSQQFSRRSEAGFHYNLNDPNTALVFVEDNLESKLQSQN